MPFDIQTQPGDAALIKPIETKQENSPTNYSFSPFSEENMVYSTQKIRMNQKRIKRKAKSEVKNMREQIDIGGKYLDTILS